MAKPELRDHPKFLKLRRLLGEPTPHVIGYLDCLWHRGYQTGNPTIGDSDDIEAAAEYPGQAGVFAQSALAARLIDEVAPGMYAIHDLYDHAPVYARKRMVRKGNGPEGVMPSVSARNENDSARNPSRSARRTKPRTKNLEPRTKKNPPNPPSGGTSARIPEPIDQSEFHQAWANWKTYRAERRKKLTPSTEASQLGKLAKMGLRAAVQSIEESIAHGWTGLFPPKDAPGQATREEPRSRPLSDFEAAHGTYNPHTGFAYNTRLCDDPNCSTCAAKRAEVAT